MEKVFLDTENSKKLSELGDFKPKHCYDNIYNNLAQLGKDGFKELDIKVMFAYVSVGRLKNVYTRHACYYIDGKAIDPTIYNLYRDDIEHYNVHYLPIKIMTMNEYFSLLSMEHRTDLFKTLSIVEEIKQKEYVKNGAMFIG